MGKLKVNKLIVRSKNLPEKLDGIRILHLSDFHFVKGDKIVNKLITNLKNQNYDLTCLTGDYADSEKGLKILKQVFRAIKTKNIFAILGNHDYRYLDKLKEILNNSKIKLLVNEGTNLTLNNENLFIGGTDVTVYDDVQAGLSGRADVEKTMKNSQDGFKLLLTHSPDTIEDAVKNNADLVLAGHTHGGQIRLPLIGAIYASSKYGTKYASGLFKINNTKMYVTKGIGKVKVNLGKKRLKIPLTNIRLNCPSEISIITLRGA